MLVTRGPRLVLAALLVAVVLVLVPVVALTRSASAYVPAADLINAIEQLRTANGGVPRPTMAGPDGIAGADGTADGQGAFLVLRNGPVTTVPVTGYAAIWAHRDGGNVIARYVTYETLAAWAPAGHERGYGYPVTNPRTANAYDIYLGCRAGDTTQYFRQLQGARRLHVLCLTAGRPTWKQLA